MKLGIQNNSKYCKKKYSSSFCFGHFGFRRFSKTDIGTYETANVADALCLSHLSNTLDSRSKVIATLIICSETVTLIVATGSETVE